jgi:Uma2 family endonuclease
MATASLLADDRPPDNLLLHIPAAAHTLSGFRAWVLSDDFPEKQPVTFINGEIYLDMSKENIFTHAAVKTPVAVVVGGLVRDDDLGDLFINGVLVTNVEANVSGNPDMVAVLWDSLESRRVRYVTNQKDESVEIEGSPDWVLEIVTNSSVKKDTHDLRQAYHQAGVREYWLIDARGADLKFQILHWRKKGYVAAPRQENWQRSEVFGRSFQLSRTRDRRGNWRYKLAVKIV